MDQKDNLFLYPYSRFMPGRRFMLPQPLFLLLSLLPLLLSACTAPPPAQPAQTAESAESAGSARHDQAGRNEPFVFAYMSDTQADPEEGSYGGFGAMLAQAMEGSGSRRKPALLLLGGDTVNDGADESEWDAFRQACGSSLEGVTIAAAAGNHDNHKLLAEQFDFPDASQAGAGRSWFYTFLMDKVHFTIMDSNSMGAAKEADIAWLESALGSEAAAHARWRIALCHHPFFPVADIPKDAERAQTMREYFLPLLEKYDVDLLLVGHQHLYARSLPMLGGEPAADGLVQVMAASGGKASYIPEDRPYLARTAPAPVYILLEAYDNTLSLAVYDADDTLVDTYCIDKEHKIIILDNPGQNE